MFLRIGWRGRARLKREALDRLFLVVFPDLEILGFQIVDVVPLLVGHHRVHQDQLGLAAEHGSRIRRRLSASRRINHRRRKKRGQTKHALKIHNRTPISICLIKSSRNLDHAVTRRHGLTFRIPHHQPDHIVAGRHVEVGPHRQARIQQLLQSRIL